MYPPESEIQKVVSALASLGVGAVPIVGFEIDAPDPLTAIQLCLQKVYEALPDASLLESAEVIAEII